MAMVSRSNKHIRKFNQLVDVHDPDGIDRLDTVTSREEDHLQERLDQILGLQDRVAALSTAAFFDEEERTRITEAESMPGPDAAADSNREEMLGRLEAIQDSLEEALARGETLDASDDLGG